MINVNRVDIETFSEDSCSWDWYYCGHGGFYLADDIDPLLEEICHAINFRPACLWECGEYAGMNVGAVFAYTEKKKVKGIEKRPKYFTPYSEVFPVNYEFFPLPVADAILNTGRTLTCLACGGTGLGEIEEDCKECGGTGGTYRYGECEACEGTGVVKTRTALAPPCKHCGGSGRVKDSQVNVFGQAFNNESLGRLSTLGAKVSGCVTCFGRRLLPFKTDSIKGYVISSGSSGPEIIA